MQVRGILGVQGGRQLLSHIRPKGAIPSTRRPGSRMAEEHPRRFSACHHLALASVGMPIPTPD